MKNSVKPDEMAFLAAIVASSDDAIISKNTRNIITSWNAGAARIFGYTVEEAVGQPMTLIVPEEYRSEEEVIFSRVLKGERIEHFETVRKTRDGRRLNISLTVSPIRDAKGDIVGVSKVARDITGRKRTETDLAVAREDLSLQVRTLTALHDLAMKLAGVVELPDALRSITNTLVAQHEADAGVLLLHDEQEQRLIVRASTGLSPELLAGVFAHLSRSEGSPSMEAFASGRRRTGSSSLGWEGKLGFRSIHAIPIQTRAGGILGVLSAYFREERAPTDRERQLADICARHAGDIVERTRSQQALRESEQLYRAIGESINYGVWIANASGQLRYASASFLTLTGLSLEEAQDLGWARALDPATAENVLAAWRECVRQRGQWDIEVRYRGADGHMHPVLVRGVPVKDEKGHVTAWVGIHLDIQRLKEAEDELRLIDQRKNEFLAVLAHELRNPLAPLRNAVEIIRLSHGNATSIESARSIMERQLTQMTRLIDDLLDLSRISSGKIDLRREVSDISSIVHSAVETSRPLIDAASHKLELDLPSGPLWVLADGTRMAQVIANLLNNATRYTPRGGLIRLAVHPREENVVITVSDNGGGIPVEMLPKVFEMFTQVDRSLERSSGGLGIGLSLARRIVEMHGGSISARSEGLGRGSEFTVTLPRQIKDPAPAPSAMDRIAPPPSGSHRRILIADDNVDSAASLAMMLKILGHEVRVVYDGMAAVDTACEFHPEIILLDIGMPRLNGYDVCRRLRKEPVTKQCLIVALTGWGQESARAESRAAGFDRHLVKPIEMSDLRAVVESPAPA